MPSSSNSPNQESHWAPMLCSCVLWDMWLTHIVETCILCLGLLASFSHSLTPVTVLPLPVTILIIGIIICILHLDFGNWPKVTELENSKGEVEPQICLTPQFILLTSASRGQTMGLSGLSGKIKILLFRELILKLQVKNEKSRWN